MPVILDCEILVGTSGAVTSFKGNGVASVTRNSAGSYTLALNQPYNSCILVIGGMQAATAAISGISAVECQNVPSTSVSSTSAPSLTITTLAATSSSVTTLIATDPASTSTIQVMAILSNSSVLAGKNI